MSSNRTFVGEIVSEKERILELITSELRSFLVWFQFQCSDTRSDFDYYYFVPPSKNEFVEKLRSNATTALIDTDFNAFFQLRHSLKTNSKMHKPTTPHAWTMVCLRYMLHDDEEKTHPPTDTKMNIFASSAGSAMQRRCVTY